jgi:hypothetical protein
MHALSLCSVTCTRRPEIKKPPKASGGRQFPLEILLRNSRSAHRAITLPKAPWLSDQVAGIPYWNPLLMLDPIIHKFTIKSSYYMKLRDFL